MTVEKFVFFFIPDRFVVFGKLYLALQGVNEMSQNEGVSTCTNKFFIKDSLSFQKKIRKNPVNEDEMFLCVM